VVNAETGEIIIPANRKITKTLLRKLASVYDHIEIDPSPIRIKIREIISSFESKFEQLKNEREVEMDRVESGDDVDPGIVKQVKVFVASSASSRSVTRWPAATATRAWSPRSCPRRTCLSCPTELRWKSCSTRSACLRA
jgi:predicted PP-loop superfamily ATPase